jgi:hypothetical protein
MGSLDTYATEEEAVAVNTKTSRKKKDDSNIFLQNSKALVGKRNRK